MSLHDAAHSVLTVMPCQMVDPLRVAHSIVNTMGLILNVSRPLRHRIEQRLASGTDVHGPDRELLTLAMLVLSQHEANFTERLSGMFGVPLAEAWEAATTWAADVSLLLGTNPEEQQELGNVTNLAQLPPPRHKRRVVVRHLAVVEGRAVGERVGGELPDQAG